MAQPPLLEKEGNGPVSQPTHSHRVTTCRTILITNQFSIFIQSFQFVHTFPMQLRVVIPTLLLCSRTRSPPVITAKSISHSWIPPDSAESRAAIRSWRGGRRPSCERRRRIRF